MRTFCCGRLEPCHSTDCSGIEEVEKLLPSGRLWNLARSSVAMKILCVLGDIKTVFNRIVCQEYNELNPCTAIRLLPYWADLYYFPADCLELNQENMCKWVDLMEDKDCPPGSLGFYKRAIECVLPGKDIDVKFNPRGFFATAWHADYDEAFKNSLVITGPAECFSYERLRKANCSDIEFRTFDHAQDGVNFDRRYFIKEIECLRGKILPWGLSLGYMTTGSTGDPDIVGVSDENQSIRPEYFLDFDCEFECVPKEPEPEPEPVLEDC